jgi:enoyl-CoA hydratase/carnithine racemase
VTTRFRVASVPVEQVLTVPLPGRSTPELWEALTAVGRSLTGVTRVVVLRGEADDFFDGAAVDGSSDEPPAAAIEWLGRPDLITIAAIAGRGAGAGLDVALACDLRVVADDAQLTPSRSIGSVARLGELMGYSRALAYILADAAISGTQAVADGLANLSVESARLDAAVADMVATVLRTPREVATVAKAVLIESGADRRRVADELVAGLRLAAAEF